jgi:hypothetical protein
MARILIVLDFIFGCHHWHLSRVFTIDRRTYRVCCDCGAKFNYSLESMRMERSVSGIWSKLDAAIQARRTHSSFEARKLAQQ